MATVASTPRTTEITLASTSAGPFLVGFRLFSAAGLDVYVNGIRQTSGYTVAFSPVLGYDDNATVTFGVALASGTVIQFDGAELPQRTADYANPDPLLTAKINSELARLWASVSEINQLVRRSVRSLDPLEAVDGIDPDDIENLPANLAAAASAASTATAAATTATTARDQVLAVQESLPEWRGPWVTARAYGLGDLVSQSGNTYICIIAHTSGTFSTDLSAARWQIFAEKGAAGAGTGDMLAANNLSDVANKPAALATLGGQPVDTDLTAIAGLATNGLIAKTNSGAAATRTITGGAGIAVTDGDGVSGNPVISSLLAGRNRIINGQGRINQRAYVSGTNTTGANQYTLDRWRVVVSGQNLTFTGNDAGRTMTAPAGGCEQVIEGANIEGGTYTINWTGTATCTVNGVSRAKGATFTLTANTNATVRFTSGTFTDVQLELGSVPTPFERLPLGDELARCQRYYEIGGAAVSTPGVSSGGWYGTVQFKANKRGTPSMAVAANITGTLTSFINISTHGATSIHTTVGSLAYSTWTADAEL